MLPAAGRRMSGRGRRVNACADAAARPLSTPTLGSRFGNAIRVGPGHGGDANMPLLEHGTRGRYWAGCECDECYEGWRVAVVAELLARRERQNPYWLLDRAIERRRR